MRLIVGLGNPGKKYERSRHNIGFMVADELARKLLPVSKTVWKKDKNANSEFIVCNSSLVLTKPQTMVNASGVAVKKLAARFKVEPSQIWVVHDEIDLPLGKIKIVEGRGAGGHRGIQSIIRELGADNFIRFRLGVGHPAREDKWLVSGGSLMDKQVKRQEVVKYVLEGFGGKDAVEADKMVDKAASAIQLALKEGIEKAQATYY